MVRRQKSETIDRVFIAVIFLTTMLTICANPST